MSLENNKTIPASRISEQKAYMTKKNLLQHKSKEIKLR